VVSSMWDQISHGNGQVLLRLWDQKAWVTHLTRPLIYCFNTSLTYYSTFFTRNTLSGQEILHFSLTCERDFVSLELNNFFFFFFFFKARQRLTINTIKVDVHFSFLRSKNCRHTFYGSETDRKIRLSIKH